MSNHKAARHWEVGTGDLGSQGLGPLVHYIWTFGRRSPNPCTHVSCRNRRLNSGLDPCLGREWGCGYFQVLPDAMLQSLKRERHKLDGEWGSSSDRVMVSGSRRPMVMSRGGSQVAKTGVLPLFPGM